MNNNRSQARDGDSAYSEFKKGVTQFPAELWTTGLVNDYLYGSFDRPISVIRKAPMQLDLRKLHWLASSSRRSLMERNGSTYRPALTL